MRHWPELAHTAVGYSDADWKRLRANNPIRYNDTLRAVARHRADESFWYFCKYVLRNPVLYEPLHRPMCDRLQRWNKFKKLELMSRGHVKSNIITVAYPLWRACKNHDIRIAIGSHKDPDAKKFLHAIRRIIEGNAWFRDVYPDVRPALNRKGREAKWSEYMLRIGRDADLVENTFEATSREVSVTGRHYDGMVLDDLVTMENVRHPLQIEQTQEFHRLCESLLDPGAWEILTGTRYDHSDEYGRIIDTPEVADQYDISVIPCINDLDAWHEFLAGREWTRENDFDYLAFPSRFTLAPRDYVDPDNPMNNRKSLLATYRVQGSQVFANQYLLVPYDPADQLLRSEDLVFVDELPKNPNLRFYRCVDASGESTKQDSFTAVITVAVDERCNLFITDIWWGIFENFDLCTELLRGQQVPERIRPLFVSLERGIYERAMKPFLDRMSREAQVVVPTRYVPPQQQLKQKDERIMGLQPWLENHKIHVLTSCKHRELLVEELDRFPKFKRKDIIDALAQAPHTILPGNANEFLYDAVVPMMPEPVKKGATFNDTLKAIQRRKKGSIGNDRVMQFASRA